MKSLVLGGCGFIGSHLVDRLLQANGEVRVLDCNTEQYRKPLSDVQYLIGEFNDLNLLEMALDGVDIVYHLISTTVPSTSIDDPAADVRQNLTSTLQLLKLMVQKQIPKIVFTSSGGTAYGIPEEIPVPESHPLRPICSHGVVKVAVENYIHMFHHLYGIDYIILRPSNPYGARQGHVGVQGVIATFMANVLANNPIQIWGDGGVVRDFIYIEDLAELCLLAGRSDARGAFNAGSGQGHSLNDIVAILTRIVGKPINTVYQSGRAYDVPRIVLDNSNAIKTFDWAPTEKLEDGMKLTWKWTVEQA